MDIFKTIISFLSSLLGNSAFADGAHALMREMGAAKQISVYDAATQTATDLLNSGATVLYTLTQVAARHDLPVEHAAVVTAGALAVKQAAVVADPSA